MTDAPRRKRSPERKPDDPYLRAMAKLLEQEIEKSGLPKQEVARRAAEYDPTVHGSTLSMFLGARRRAKLKQISALAKALGIPVERLTPSDSEQQAATSPVAKLEEPNAEDRVRSAMAAFVRRQGRELDDEEKEIVSGFLKAIPPAVLDDALIEGLLRELRRSLWRATKGAGPR
jgi:hypothetical protein